MNYENYLLTLSKIIPLYYEDVQYLFKPKVVPIHKYPCLSSHKVSAVLEDSPLVLLSNL